MNLAKHSLPPEHIQVSKQHLQAHCAVHKAILNCDRLTSTRTMIKQHQPWRYKAYLLFPHGLPLVNHAADALSALLLLSR